MIFSFFEGHTTSLPIGFDKTFWEKSLQDIWTNRYSFGMEENTRYNFNKDSNQVILTFSDNKVMGGNFVGSIAKKGQRINIYPKIFWSEANEEYSHFKSEEFSKYVFSHLFWWLGHTKENLRLIKIENDTGDTSGDLLEVLIYYFAFYTERLLEEFDFHDYELIQNEALVVKGRILMPEWLDKISKQNWQKIPCEYSEFQYDNLLNRIIKFVSRILISLTKSPKSKYLLDEILYHLDGVTDVEIVSNDCDSVKLNPLFEEYRIILDSCRMFLDSLIIDYNDTSQSTFSFLVRMDWLYQNFLMGFINQNRNNFNLRKVDGSGDFIGRVKGTNRNCFSINLDYLFVFSDGRKIIGDAKYKRLKSLSQTDDGLGKYNIDTSDLYQMIAYSFRKGINDIVLLYPKYDDSNYFKNVNEKFEILNSDGESDIELTVCTLSISYGSKFEDDEYRLSFDQVSEKLIAELKEVLNR